MDFLVDILLWCKNIVDKLVHEFNQACHEPRNSYGWVWAHIFVCKSQFLHVDSFPFIPITHAPWVKNMTNLMSIMEKMVQPLIIILKQWVPKNPSLIMPTMARHIYTRFKHVVCEVLCAIRLIILIRKSLSLQDK